MYDYRLSSHEGVQPPPSDYGYDNEKAGETDDENNADDYGDKHDVLYLARIVCQF